MYSLSLFQAEVIILENKLILICLSHILLIAIAIMYKTNSDDIKCKNYKTNTCNTI